MTNELGEKTDALTLALADAEEELAALGLGVSAQVELDERTWLVFAKEGPEWSLLVIYKDDPSVRNPLLKTSRLARTMAARKLGELRTKLYEAYQFQLADVAEATATARIFVEEMRRPNDG